jgi:hypothetical protein
MALRMQRHRDNKKAGESITDGLCRAFARSECPLHEERAADDGRTKAWMGGNEVKPPTLYI